MEQVFLQLYINSFTMFISKKRLSSEAKILANNSSEGIKVWLDNENDLYNWMAEIKGPENTAWEGAVFRLKMVFPENYPSSPPKVTFLTKIFHPNVYENGSICIDILSNSGWKPYNNIQGLLVSLRSFLNEPNPSSPANGNAGKLYQNNPEEYFQKVKENNIKYATPNL